MMRKKSNALQFQRIRANLFFAPPRIRTSPKWGTLCGAALEVLCWRLRLASSGAKGSDAVEIG